ncbi:MAG: P-II family nitrogen regulator [Betaproteobacteria bacterium]|nr:P-II family nitrogen regulator [Betaproteobacteria bacterium]
MKEIKAYIRQHRIADVLQALRDSGICDPATCDRATSERGCHLTVSQVQRPLAGADPSQQHYSMELAEPVVAEYKLELVCVADAVGALVEVIAKAAHTGRPEAGWIYVSEVQRAVEIR